MRYGQRVSSLITRLPDRSTTLLSGCTCHRVRLLALIDSLQQRRLSITRRQNAEKPQPPQGHAVPPPPIPPTPTVKQLAGAIQQASRSGLVRNIVEPYAAYGSTERLFKQILKQADYTVPNRLKKPPEPAPKNQEGEDIGQGTGAWFASRNNGGMDLPVTFGTWAQIMILHIYILTVRMRMWPDKKQLRAWEQQLLDHFSYAAEEKMDKWHGMAARGVRNKHLKDLWLQYRGDMLSYDEGLAKGDAVLAAAVWRSIFKGSEDANIADIALVVAYLRREVQKLETVTDATITSGQYEFSNLSSLQQSLLKSRSLLMDVPFTSADRAALDAGNLAT